MINITEMLEKTEKTNPDGIAYTDPESSVTYGELLEGSKKTASFFLSEEIIKPREKQNAVAFYMEKSCEAMQVIFGAVYAGALYSFIDVRQPADRALKVLSVLEPSVIITDQKNMDPLNEILKDKLRIPVFEIKELISRVSSFSVKEELIERVSVEHYDLKPLYVNFTSGSTGAPKGVAVSHRSVIDFISEFTEVFDINDKDIIANQAPFDFDVSVKDIYSGLYKGARVVLIPREYFSNPTVLMDYLGDNEVTTLIWAVSAMCFVSIMNGLEYRIPNKINKIMFSGELMPVKHLNKWKKFIPNALYVNLYGPTEITCNCTYHIIDREYENNEIIPVGIPFKNEKVFLLDEDNNEIKETDTEGEICVGGTCLALGYYKDEEKTALSFVQNPLNKCFYERIYRTGDIGKYDEEGRLIYTSRKDFQIKHMGQRIELGEIEVAAMSEEEVSRACCLYDMKKKRIVLIYTGDMEKAVLNGNLHTKLPPYMIPGKTVKIDEFPLNKNGKIDRKALEEYL
ncbi:MAG: AMP-binding protein [Lachnospiraceae bacterium]|nr:AMP-binding protein [Lachnospiraceae bacterium]